MRQVFKALGLLLLLMVAQQGAVVHELSHVSSANNVELLVQSGGTAEMPPAHCVQPLRKSSPRPSLTRFTFRCSFASLWSA